MKGKYLNHTRVPKASTRLQETLAREEEWLDGTKRPERRSIPVGGHNAPR